MEQTIILDNQQENSRFIELSWLAGIIDGEGTITLTIHNRKNHTPVIKPKVTIVNTDLLIIEKIKEILKNNEIAFWVTEYEGNKNWQKRYVIEISGIKRLLNFLPKINPYLIGKKNLGEMVLEWCDNRYDKAFNKHRRIYYTQEDIDLLTKIKSYHGHQDRVCKNLEILRDYMSN